jgi:hypothetical protein
MSDRGESGKLSSAHGLDLTLTIRIVKHAAGSDTLVAQVAVRACGFLLRAYELLLRSD